MANDLDAIGAVLDGFISGASGSVGALNDTGKILLGSITTLILVWNTLKILIEGGGARKMLAQAIHIGMMFSFAFFLIDKLPDVTKYCVESVDAVGKAVAPTSFNASGGEQSGSQIAMAAIAPMLDAAISVQQSESPKVQKKPEESVGLVALFTAVNGFFTGFNNYLLSIVLKVLTIGILVIAGLIAFGHFMVSQILIYLAIIIAPILIPFLVWEAASFIFDGWLKFFIKALFHKLIGLIILTIMSLGVSGALAKIGGQAGITSFGEAEAFRLTGMIALMAIAVATVYLANQIPTIADGLLSGMARSGMGFSPSKPRGTGMPKAKGSETQSTKTVTGADGSVTTTVTQSTTLPGTNNFKAPPAASKSNFNKP
jgi:type IV secretory pathway VirB6-like protein